MKGELTLIWADNDQGSVFRVDAEILVCMTVALVVALVVVVNFVKI
jgi:hypothetical protein